ncbi:glutathione S-transferase U7 [Amborella trichopoda]|uniref:glutathione S-transferase U7 n=1 Tax=Amborella trichopoda TaxID=13333 RepID=UPI0009C19678|nr:glutathione S-transferase U7 [Amborella trichopoda]|eukprot:XP_020520227.1 glutathione S-transferase U7 [Amborella trichopoda]
MDKGREDRWQGLSLHPHGPPPLSEGVKILGTWTSPFCLRVELALNLKGISYEYIEQDLRNKSPLLLQLNPVHKKAPVLIHNDKAISESLIILEYIDETWQKIAPLVPENAYKKALVRFWADFFERKVIETTIEFTENLKVFEHGVQKDFEGENPFFNGEIPGFLGVVVCSLSSWIKVLEMVSGERLVVTEKTCVLFMASCFQ